jgi:hypothetical protein
MPRGTEGRQMDLKDKVYLALRKGFGDEGITDGIIRLCVEHAEDKHLWLVAENCDLRQTVEELEIELMLMENDIGLSMLPKTLLNLTKRGNF